MIKTIKEYLNELGFSKNETDVYLALSKLGEAKASQIAKVADLPRTTAISILNKLTEENYITTHLYKGVLTYWIESPQVLSDILQNKIMIAEKLKDLLPNLYHADGHFPFGKFFDTKKSIKNFIEKTLNTLEKNTTIYTIDTPHEGNYDKIFSNELNSIVFDIKKKKGIITKTLIPSETFSSISQNKLAKQNIIIKELPKNLGFSGSLWIIKDTLINFSGNPPFLSVINHKAIVQGIKGIYNFLWNISIDKNN